MMSENSEIWNLNALCRCCHSDGYFKNLQRSYSYNNEKEIYSKMLQEAFNVEIKPPPVDASYTICDVCILHLREACQFKKQVLLCERKFEEYIKNELAGAVGSDGIKIEAEFDVQRDDCGDNDCDDNKTHVEIEIKNLFTKKEENENGLLCNKEIKCEGPNESKISIEIIPEVETKNDSKKPKSEPKKKVVKKHQQKKKGVKKKQKSKRRLKYGYDPTLEVHVATDAGVVYSCKACGGGYTDLEDLRMHIAATHTDRKILKYKCKHCYARFPTEGRKYEHLRTHAESALNCSHCSKQVFSKKALKEHEMTHTRTAVFKCDLCEKEFGYKATLIRHLRAHYGTQLLICHLCGRGFNDRTNLNTHIRTVHEKQRPYVCTLCPKTFPAQKDLKIHIRKHTGERPYACDQCPEKFHCASTLANHKITHLQTERYVCKVCRKRFADRLVFVRHLKRAHVGERPYRCGVCDRDFNCKYSMKRHELEHSGVKRFQCDQCGAKFSQNGAMKRHVNRKHAVLKVETVEKCDVCKKTVPDLEKHMISHNNKRFPCEFCDKSYSENNVLTRHKKVVHFGVRPHVCEYCDKKYVKVTGLRNHQLKAHNVVSKVETDNDFDSAVSKFSIKNKKGKLTMSS